MDEVRAHVPVLHSLHDSWSALRIMHRLRKRDIKHRRRWPAKSPARPARVFHDANDAERAGIFRQSHAEVTIERIFAIFKKSLHESFIHNRDIRRGLIISFGEIAASPKWLVKQLQIIRAQAYPRRFRVLVELSRRMALDHDHLAPVVGERVIEREAR